MAIAGTNRPLLRTWKHVATEQLHFEETDAEIPIVREDVQQVGQESVGQSSSETNTQCDSCLPELSSSIKPGFHIVLNV